MKRFLTTTTRTSCRGLGLVFLVALGGCSNVTPEEETVGTKVERLEIRTNEEFVTALYFDFLGRDPDAAGFAGWVAALNTNQLTRDQLIAAFGQSDEYLATRLLPLNYCEYGSGPYAGQDFFGGPFCSGLGAKRVVLDIGPGIGGAILIQMDKQVVHAEDVRVCVAYLLSGPDRAGETASCEGAEGWVTLDFLRQFGWRFSENYFLQEKFADFRLERSSLVLLPPGSYTVNVRTSNRRFVAKPYSLTL